MFTKMVMSFCFIAAMSAPALADGLTPAERATAQALRQDVKDAKQANDNAAAEAAKAAYKSFVRNAHQN